MNDTRFDFSLRRPRQTDAHVCVVIDHFSRKVMSVTPLEGRNAGWIDNAAAVHHTKRANTRSGDSS